MGQGGILLDCIDDVALEVGIVTCKLVCKGRKDVFELSSIKVIPGTKKASAKKSLIGNNV